MQTVVILGAKGRFGRAATQAFVAAGWDVRAFGRNWTDSAQAGVTRVTGDVMDPAALAEACRGRAVIVNAVHPPYPLWSRDMSLITQAVITAARDAGATVLVPGNVYNYGADKPAVLRETTPWHPTTVKGQLRVEMENSFRSSGVRTIVLRAGDFIEREKSGNWFDSHISVKSQEGRTMYPGPRDVPHAWAYLPDMARAAVMLAEKRQAFEGFEEFGFDGFGVTGAELVQVIEEVTGKKQKLSSMPWSVMKLLGLFNANIREVCEMRYLWQVEHVLDGAKLRAALPTFKPTPMKEAIAEAMA